MELISHPAASSLAVRRVSASCQRPDPGVLLLQYRVEGDIGRLRIAPPVAPARRDELWRHTCLEAFVQPVGAERYSEFNLSPSTQWAAYGFDAYRAGMRPLLDVPDPLLAVQSAADVLALTARITLPAQDAGSRLVLGLTAVIEADDGSLSWWALRHAGNKPDFHLAASFISEC